MNGRNAKYTVNNQGFASESVWVCIRFCKDSKGPAVRDRGEDCSAWRSLGFPTARVVDPGLTLKGPKDPMIRYLGFG